MRSVVAVALACACSAVAAPAAPAVETLLAGAAGLVLERALPTEARRTPLSVAPVREAFVVE